MTKHTTTAERLRELLTYDPETGEFHWLARRRGMRQPGMRAGNVAQNGYRRISIDDHSFYEHRLAFLYVTGEWPPQCVDHINRVKHDNRLANLRLVTVAQNGQNIPLRRSNGGLLGASYTPPDCRRAGDNSINRWRATIEVEGVKHSLGMFPTQQAAHEAYLTAKERLHPFRGVQ